MTSLIARAIYSSTDGSDSIMGQPSPILKPWDLTGIPQTDLTNGFISDPAGWDGLVHVVCNGNFPGDGRVSGPNTVPLQIGKKWHG